MSLNFLSGLLLIIVAAGVVAYVVKELFGDRIRERAGESAGGSATVLQRLGHLSAVRRDLAAFVGKHVGADAKPINAHLIGTTGTVVGHSDDDARPMRVRLGMELWPARSGSGEDDRAPIGTAVEVIAVEGPIVVVRAATSGATEQPP